MDSTADIKQRREALISRVDEQLAHTYEQIKSADEQLAQMEALLAGQDREASRPHPRRSRKRPWLRGIAGLLLVGYIAAAAFVSQSPYGDAVAHRAPQLVSVLMLPLEKLVQLTAAESAPLAQVAPHDVTLRAGPASAEPTKSLQTMQRDLDSMEREIVQLKASQQQLASDNAKAIDQIKASQEQAARDIARNVELVRASQEQLAQLVARVSEQSARPKTTAPQPQRAVGTRKPVPAPATIRASAQP